MFTNNQDIEQICIVGLGCPQPLALAVLSEVGRAKAKGKIEVELRHLLDETNKELPNFQKISTIVIHQKPWSVDNGLLTPTLKVKRNVLHQQYSDCLISWHENSEQIIWEE